VIFISLFSNPYYTIGKRDWTVEFYMLFFNLGKGVYVLMLRRLKEKLKKRWKDFLGRGRVPTTFKE
jgi:hypothetical protein